MVTKQDCKILGMIYVSAYKRADGVRVKSHCVNKKNFPAYEGKIKHKDIYGMKNGVVILNNGQELPYDGYDDYDDEYANFYKR